MMNDNNITLDTPLPVVHTPEETKRMVQESLSRSRDLLNVMDHSHKEQMIELMIFMLEAEFGVAPETSQRLVETFSHLDHALTGHGLPGEPGLPNEADVAFDALVDKSYKKVGVHMMKRMSYFLLEAERSTNVSAEKPSES